MTTSSGGQRAKLFLWIKQLLLAGGFLMLMCEVRFEHRQVVPDEWKGWIPVGYSALMLLIIPAAVAIYQRGGKKLLLALYAIGILVGCVGVFIHAEGHFVQRIQELLVVWQHLVNKIDPTAPFHPPILAPLAFVGLGSIGLVLTLDDNGH